MDTFYGNTETNHLHPAEKLLFPEMKPSKRCRAVIKSIFFPHGKCLRFQDVLPFGLGMSEC